MPRLSYKQKFLLDLEESIGFFIVFQLLHERRRQQLQLQLPYEEDRVVQMPGDSLLRTALFHPRTRTLMLFYFHMSSQRYIQQRERRQRPINKFMIDLHRQPVLHQMLPWLNDLEFINAYRMTRKAFHLLLDKIKDHPIFHRGRRGPSQAPVEYQLMTLLHYISSAGSAASGHRTRNHFHIAYGCRDKYIHRCIMAIRSCMRRSYYHWPDANEREELAEQFHRLHGLPNAVVVVDGTTFRMMQKPKREDAADYSGRKDGYTITNLFFSDLNRKIRYYSSGWAGSTHDNRMWHNCKIFRNPNEFLSETQYIIGDSAFENSHIMVTTYRAPTGGLLQGSKQKFNDLLSSPRVISEHVNGILKGRWSWLNCIPNTLDESVHSMRKILKIIDVTVILHNFLIEHNLQEDEKYFYIADNENGPTDLAAGDELNQPVPVDSPFGNTARREQLRAYLSVQGYI